MVKLTKQDYKILEYLSRFPEASKQSICKSLKHSEEVVGAHLNYLYENKLIDEKTDLDFSSDFIYTKFLGVYSITDKGIKALSDYRSDRKEAIIKYIIVAVITSIIQILISKLFQEASLWEYLSKYL